MNVYFVSETVNYAWSFMMKNRISSYKELANCKFIIDIYDLLNMLNHNSVYKPFFNILLISGL